MSSAAIIYCRVSSPGQDSGPGHVSLDNQEQSCVEFCKNNKLEILEIVREISSAKDISKQKALNRIARQILPGTVLIFYNINRFSRNIMQALTLINKIQAKGAEVYSVIEKCG